ncbi:Vacuolar protein sorting-associated protein 41 [Galdieria sulphuraria]|nr:Vacuolar protein sorting-associated protein 41 [Galdieria sulphuraria]
MSLETGEEEEPVFHTSYFLSNTVGIREEQLVNGNKTVVTAITAGTKVIACGTLTGSIYLVDCSGSVLIKSLECKHSNAVRDLSLSEDNSVVVSVGKGDTTVCISFVFEERNSLQYNYSKSRLFTGAELSSVAVDPFFGRVSSPQMQRFCFGTTDGELLLHTKSWLGGGSDAVLHHGEGPIYCIKWQGDLIAWANNRGIRIFDVRFERGPRENKAKKSSSIELPFASLEPRLTWRHLISDTYYSLYVCWYSCCKVISVSSTAEGKSGRRQVRVLGNISKDELHVRNIVQVAPFGDKAVAMLCVGQPSDQKALFYADKTTVAPIADTFSMELVIVSLSQNDLSKTRTERKVINNILFSEEPLQKNSLSPSRQGLVHIPGGEPILLAFSTCLPESLLSGHIEDVYDENSENDASQARTGAVWNVLSLRPFSYIERIEWMLDRERYREAVEIAEMAPANQLLECGFSIEKLGERFINHLLEKGDYDTLAIVLPRMIHGEDTEFESFTSGIEAHLTAKRMEKESSEGLYTLESRKRRWEFWIKKLIQIGKLQFVVFAIPCRDPTLSSATYDEVLRYLLQVNPILFTEVINTWPADVYNLGLISREVELAIERLKNTSTLGSNEEGVLSKLQEAMATLYTSSGRHDKTLELIFEEGDIRCFDYIREHALYEAIRSRESLRRLFEISEQKASELLGNAPESLLPPEVVVPILQELGNRRWLFLYLDFIFSLDPSRAVIFHPMQVSLYAECAPEKLLQFLKESSSYSLDNALEELSRMGDLTTAMDIILFEMDQVNEAIQFCKEHEDPSLWNRLLGFAENDGRILVALLYDPSCGIDSLRL